MGLFLDDGSRKLRSGWVIAVFCAIAAGSYGLCSGVVSLLGLHPREPLTLDDPYLFFTTVVMLVAATSATVPCVLFLNAEAGLPRAGALGNLLKGLGLGAGLVLLTVFIPVAVGQAPLGFSSDGAAALLEAALLQAVVLVPTSVGEELLLRGVLLRQLAKGTRAWLAVLLTAATFGVMHLLNPDATWVAALNVALVGVWFGLLALRFTLWAAIGAHVAWNFFEGFVLGQPVSGINPGPSLFVGPIVARGFFSGGAFGPEASGLTGVLLVIAVIWTLTPLLTNGSSRAQ